MAEIMRLLESNGTFKSELMENFLSSAQLSSTNSSSVTTGQTLTNVNANLNITATASSTQFVNDNLIRAIPVDNLNANTHSNLNEINKPNLAPQNSTNLNIGAKPDIKEDQNGNTNSGHEQTVTTTQKKVEQTGARPITSMTNVNSSIDVTETLTEVQEKPAESRQLLLDHVTGAIIDAHINTTINTYANVAAANERIQREKNEMPDMCSLSINVTNLWQHFMSSMVPEITKVINFCTRLPGFSEIQQEDKMRLVKQGCFEVMVARFCILIDHINEEMLDPTLTVKAPRSAVKEMPMGPFLDQFFTVAGQFNPIGLTDAEIGLFTAVLMISPERKGLTNQPAIKVLQKLIIQALYLQLKQNHEDANKTLTSLMNMVPVFHKISEEHLKFIQMIKMKSPAEFDKKFPLLHKELFDTC